MMWSVFFCFQGYGDHRDLHVLTHSFPTRRSSDLSAHGTARTRRFAQALMYGVGLGGLDGAAWPSKTVGPDGRRTWFHWPGFGQQRARRRSHRSEERRVGEEWVRTLRSRWAPYH